MTDTKRKAGWYRAAAMAEAEVEAKDEPRVGALARSSAVIALWGAVLATLVAVVLIAGAVLGELDAQRPWRGRADVAGGDGAGSLDRLLLDREGSADDEDPLARRRALHLAGSGSNLPLTRELAEAFMRRWPDKRVVVFESVGSTGGVRAVHDGVVDLGLVSRPLRPQEDTLGLVVIPYARVAVAAVANLDVAEDGLRSDELVAIFDGECRQWSDGAPITVIQRERGDSSHAVVDLAVEGFAEANERAYRDERWRVVYNDRAMHEVLVSTPGSIGLLDVGTTQAQALALRVLDFDGAAPTQQNLRSGRYPFAKDLAFVSSEQPVGIARELVDFIRSSDGQALIRQRGYIPLGLEGGQ